MKLIFIGTGSAFTVGSDNYQSNMLLVEGNENLLIDCGADARHALWDLGYTYRDISNVYISHLHGDHVGGLEWLAFTRYFDKRCAKPNMFIPEVLVKDLWDKSLSGSLSSLQNKVAKLRTFFNVKSIKNNSYFTWSKTRFHIFQTIHVISECTIVPSYGLIFKANGLNVFVTTDTQFAPHQIMDFYESADIIFQDCETDKTSSGVHAHFNQLATLDKKIKNKMWLYHYNPGPLPDALKKGFRGFIKRGQCFDFANPKTLI